MPGSLTITNTINTQPTGNLSAALLDTNWTGIATYVNAREITRDTLANRAAAGTSGRWFYATDTGQLFEDNGTNWLQMAAGLIANTFTGIQRFSKGADIASAAALTLGTDGNYFQVSGTTTITSISTAVAGTVIVLEFQAALTLTHNATSLILPNAGNNITTAARDTAVFVSEGAGNWRCVVYQKADGTALVAAAAGITVLDRVTADTTVGNTLTETTIYTRSIAGGTLGTNVRLRLLLLGRIQWGTAAAGETTTLRLKYGATTLATDIVNINEGAIVPANTAFCIEAFLSGDGATNSQAGEIWSRLGGSISAVTARQNSSGDRGTAAIDSTVAQTLLVSIQHSRADVTDTYTMESAILEQL